MCPMPETWRGRVDQAAGSLHLYLSSDAGIEAALRLLGYIAYVSERRRDLPAFHWMPDLGRFIALCERRAWTKVLPSPDATPGSLCVEGVVAVLCGPLPDGSYAPDWYAAGARAAAWLDSLLDGGER